MLAKPLAVTSAHRCYITVVYLTKTDCWCQTHVRTFEGGGRTSLLLPPGAKNPSYATETDRTTVR